MDPQDLASLGVRAIASGKISLPQAVKNAKQMGLGPQGSDSSDSADPGSQNLLAMGYSPQKDQSPLSMLASPGDMYKQLDSTPQRRGAKESLSEQLTQDRKHSSNRFFSKSPDQIRAEQLMAQGVYPKVSSYDPLTDSAGNVVLGPDGKQVLDQDRPQYDFNERTTDAEHPVQQQLAGLGRMTDLLRMESEANQSRPMIDFTPLAALADARNAERGVSTNLAASAFRPSDTTGKFMQYADEIQKRRADIQKAISENAKNMRGGTTMDQLVQAVMMKSSAEQGNPLDRQGMQESALAHRAHGQLMQQLAGNKVLSQELSGYVTLSNSLSTLINAKHLNTQAIHDAQQAVRRGIQLGGGSQSGVDERAKTYIESLGFNADNLMQFLSGKPSDIEKDDDLVKTIKDFAQVEQHNLQNHYSRRIDALTGGYSWIYNDPRFSNPKDPFNNLKGAFDSAVAGHKAQVAPSGPSYHRSSGTKAPAKAAAQSNYDGSGPLPTGYTADMKQKRLDFLTKKAGR